MDERDERWHLSVREVAARGGKILFCCWRCDRRVERDAADLVDRHGDQCVAVIPMRCTTCQARGLSQLAYTRIVWPPGGKVVKFPQTLRQLERAGMSVRIACRKCRRWTMRAPHWYELWIREYGGGASDITLAELRKRLKCACGEKAAIVTVDPNVSRDQLKDK